MRRELAAVQALAARAGVNIGSSLSGGNGGISGSIRETLVLMREIGRGNWSRVPGSLSILLGQLGVLKFLVKENQVAEVVLAEANEKLAQKAALAALASTRKAAASQASLYAADGETEANLAAAVSDEEKAGADIMAAKSAQLKAVASREAAVAAEAEGAAATFTLGPLAWAAAALIAVGAAAFFAFRHYKTLAEEAENFGRVLDVTTAKFTDQADAIKHAAEEAQNFSDWVSHLADSQDDLAESTTDALDALRDQAKLERQIAEGKGASKKTLAGMDISALKKELDVVTSSKIEANRRAKLDFADAAQAESGANNPDRAARIRTLGEHGHQAGAIVDALQEEIKKGNTIGGKGFGMAGTVGGHAANAQDVLSVTVDGKKFSLSLDQARAAFNEITQEESKLSATQKRLNDLVAEKKKLTERDVADQKKFTREASKIQSEINSNEKMLPFMAQKMSHGSVNSNQQIGAFAAAASMVQLAKSSDKHLATIAKNTARLGGGLGASGRMGAVKF